MAFTRTDTCTILMVDKTVLRLTTEADEMVRSVDINNRGVNLVNVSIAALVNDTIVVCCLFEIKR